jgi:small nuclear ribonucleoprotein (snRNP)-like protein
MSTTESSPPPPPTTTFESLKRQFLGAIVRLTLKDERVVLGMLEVVDGDGNVILKNSSQINAGPTKDKSLQLGYAMIPGYAIIEVEIGTPIVTTTTST